MTSHVPPTPTAPGALEPRELSRPNDAGCLPTLAAVRLYLRADLHRYQGGTGALKFWRHLLLTPGYKYTVVMRLTGWTRLGPVRRWVLRPPLTALLLRLRHKYGIAIPEYTEIGPGLFINRFGGIYVNGDAVLGANLNLHQATMLGQSNRGAKAGSPVLGDRVYVGHGASVVGRVHVGDDAAVGTGAVVTKDVPAGAVVGGVPARVLSHAGSEGYINRQVPAELMAACLGARRR